MTGKRRRYSAEFKAKVALVGSGLGPEVPGFYLLAHRADLASGDPGSAEELQDHTCTPP